MNEKTSINFICPDLWPPTASLLQGLTVIKQCVYQMTFRNVYEFKKWRVKSGLVWSRTLSILLLVNAESILMSVFAQCIHISNSFAVGSWKTKQLDEMSSKVSRKLTNCFCALFRLSNNTAWVKKAIFCWFCFPQVVHKQTLGEVGNWTFIWWQVVSGIFVQKIIKIW